MAVLSALLAFLGRQAGRVVNVVFGWTTTMLFGKVPSEKQMWLSLVALGAVLWLVTLLGTVFPVVGTFLLVFAPIPPWIDPSWVRLAMLVAVAVIPLAIGAISSLVLTERSSRREGTVALAKSILRGYPYTVGLSVTVVLMFVFVPFLKLPAIVRRWQDQHLPVIVKTDVYDKVVGGIQEALAAAGIETERVQAPLLMRVPPKILASLAGGGIERMVAENLAMLKSKDESKPLEVVLYPSDLMVRGEPRRAANAQAVVVKQAAFLDAYLTWTKEGNELEDQLVAIWREQEHKSRRELSDDLVRDLLEFDQRLDDAKLTFDEWEVLYRERLQVTQALLEVMAGLAERPVQALKKTLAKAA